MLIGIGSTDIYIDIPSLSREELEEYSKSLFEEWEEYVHQKLELSDYSLSLSVEDGSVKALGKIGVALSALYFGIGQYGSFISGVQIIKSQVNDVTEYLGQKAVIPFSDCPIKPKVRKRGEALSRLEGIFRKVEAGKISIEEAMAESRAVLGDDGSADELYDELQESLNKIPDNPADNQLLLDVGEPEIFQIEENPPPKFPRPSKPKPPPIDHYRVVV